MRVRVLLIQWRHGRKLGFRPRASRGVAFSRVFRALFHVFKMARRTAELYTLLRCSAQRRGMLETRLAFASDEAAAGLPDLETAFRRRAQRRSGLPRSLLVRFWDLKPASKSRRSALVLVLRVQSARAAVRRHGVDDCGVWAVSFGCAERLARLVRARRSLFTVVCMTPGCGYASCRSPAEITLRRGRGARRALSLGDGSN